MYGSCMGCGLCLAFLYLTFRNEYSAAGTSVALASTSLVVEHLLLILCSLFST